MITITLLAFIVVLLVGLAAYTRIETGAAGNTQRQAQARENALMALNLAVGHLQEYAGRDDQVTATAEAVENVTGTSRYTGVFGSDPANPDAAPAWRTWLVSGNERIDADGAAQPMAVTPGSPGSTTIELVGRNSTGSTTRNASYVIAPLQTIRARGLPSAPPALALPIGRYAWWVGDQGVKAPVALPDATEQVTFAPYASAELRSRLRQQMSLGAGAADGTSGSALFEPRDSNNAPLTADEKVTALNQLPLLRWANNSTTTKLNTLKANFHTWSPNNFNVLANSKTGGLRRDLSLNPGLLGPAIEAWMNYPSYMEPFAPPPAEAGAEAGSEDPPAPTNAILPTYGTDPIRRRYPISAGAADRPRIAPVLTYFHLVFGVQKMSADAPNYTLSMRWAVALWNPYTSALVPEDLRLEISGLPTEVTIADATTDPAVDDARIDLSVLYGAPLKVTLPWAPAASTVPQERSWLPGRVYNWTFMPGEPFDRSANNPGRFNSRDLEGFEDGLIVSSVPASATVNRENLALRVPSPTSLVIQLKRANGEVLATYTSPSYEEVPISDPGSLAQLWFVFRLAESVDTAAVDRGLWLKTAGRDPREEAIPPESFVAEMNPAASRNDRIRAPQRLLDRDITTGTSYNEDVPVFELPRRPLLSLGELQHVFLPGVRPFAIGNPWGAGLPLGGVPAEQVFDRFFFSGAAADVTPGTNAAGNLMLPNRTLQVMRSAGGGRVTVDEFRGATGAHSSKYLLQGGAFNLNSTNVAAWTAVLRGIRYPAPTEFTYLDADPETGTAADDATVGVSSTNAHFFRFPQSAQEVYKAESDYVQSSPDEEDSVTARTHLFRRGMRTLNGSQVAALAARIVDFVRIKHAAADGQGGPFRSVEEFLTPNALFAEPTTPPEDPDAPPPPANPPRSLLEAAIADAGNNSSIAEFSSQWLTQADIMTALAPVLFARSDTFVIRTYGEAINPAKLNNDGTVSDAAIEGRAWCEAIVQRVPEYLDPRVPAETSPEALAAGMVPPPPPENPDDPPPPAGPPAEAYELNQKFGRRFKIVSFRWLTRSDI